ncbi:hypothetical protein [Aureimonas sp. AU12]|uniref:hypothetical protein n=1 Tax=Aureimonas sp. AU12 TaxID=1638161 RepID=UPI0007806C06|nr:hypothetical protein [Aureimonas sp. AU12]
MSGDRMFPLRSCVPLRHPRGMVQSIRTFAEAQRRNLAVRIVCGGCRREVAIAARRFGSWIDPQADPATLRFRCRSCGAPAGRVRCEPIVGGREGLSEWDPPDRPLPVRREAPAAD